MSVLSWSEQNRGRHGILITPTNPQYPSSEKFFSSRLKLYLGMLDYLPILSFWINSLPEVDLEAIIPSPEPECPICTNTYLKNLEDVPASGEAREIPIRLPCGHILGLECIVILAVRANSSSGVLCPFCRARHNHVPTSWQGTSGMLDRCMWVALDIFVRVNRWEEFQDMEAVQQWVQDDDRLCRDVADEDGRREAIKYAVQSWAEMGDDEFCRQLAVRTYGERVQFTPSLARPIWVEPQSKSQGGNQIGHVRGTR